MHLLHMDILVDTPWILLFRVYCRVPDFLKLPCCRKPDNAKITRPPGGLLVPSSGAVPGMDILLAKRLF